MPHRSLRSTHVDRQVNGPYLLVISGLPVIQALRLRRRRSRREAGAAHVEELHARGLLAGELGPVRGRFSRALLHPSGAFDGLGLDLNREVPLAELGKEGVRLEVLLGSPNTGSQGSTEYLLNSNRHVH